MDAHLFQLFDGRRLDRCDDGGFGQVGAWLRPGGSRSGPGRLTMIGSLYIIYIIYILYYIYTILYVYCIYTILYVYYICILFIHLYSYLFTIITTI